MPEASSREYATLLDGLAVLAVMGTAFLVWFWLHQLVWGF